MKELVSEYIMLMVSVCYYIMVVSLSAITLDYELQGNPRNILSP
jgi:hypothetical protein